MRTDAPHAWLALKVVARAEVAAHPYRARLEELGQILVHVKRILRADRLAVIGRSPVPSRRLDGRRSSGYR